MSYLKQNATLGFLASVIVLFSIAAVQPIATNNSAYAQSTTGPTVSVRCFFNEELGIQMVELAASNLNPDYFYYFKLLGALGEQFASFNVEHVDPFVVATNYFPEFEPYSYELYEDVNNDIRSERGELIASDAITCGESPPPPTPAEATTELISDVENLGDDVPQGTKTSIAAPLKEASNILTDDNPNNDKSACGKLDASIRQTDAAERRGTLTEQEADDLRTQAEDIRSDLGC